MRKMKKMAVVMIATASSLGMAATAVAQEESAGSEGVGAGIGVSFSNSSHAAGAELGGLGGLGTAPTTPRATIALPIEWNDSFRLEPFVGGTYQTREIESQGTGMESITLNNETTSWSIEGGLAAHFLWTIRPDVRGYGGGLLGASTGGVETSNGAAGGAGGNDVDSFGLLGGPVIGGEYLFTDLIGLGIEVGALARWSETERESEFGYEQEGFDLRPHAALHFRAMIF